MARKNDKEPTANLRLVRTKHTDSCRKDFQTRIDEITISPGDFLKFCFEDKKGNGENMWVSVVRIDNGNVIGNLQNIPLFINNVKYGDAVEKSLRDAHAHMPKKEMKEFNSKDVIEKANSCIDIIESGRKNIPISTVCQFRNFLERFAKREGGLDKKELDRFNSVMYLITFQFNQ